ncbi:MAG TPA: hypothetical protein VFE62_19990 [Gemmataceae bacterium]|nr:hypothetical protein [Gemmataceae bacterium]
MSSRPYLKLTDAFRLSFDWNQKYFGSSRFVKWAAEDRKPPVKLRRDHWNPMREGQSVPAIFIQAFAEYLREVFRHPEIDVLAISEPAVKEPTFGKYPDGWLAGWLELFFFYGRTFDFSGISPCEDEDSVSDAAEMAVKAAGREIDPSLSDDMAIAAGEQLIRRSWREYAAMLMRLREANKYSVVFAMGHNKNGEWERQGVSVAFAVTKDYYSRFRKGLVDDIDIKSKDLCGKSSYIYANALFESPDVDRRVASRKRSVCVASAVMSQFAELCLPLHKHELSLIATIGTERNGEILESYSFQKLGTRSRATQLEVMEFAPPKMGLAHSVTHPFSVAQYMAMRATLILFQVARSAREEVI